MKKYGLISLFTSLLLFLITFLSPAAAQSPKYYDALEFQPLPSIEIPRYDRYVLGNGMTVYLMEDHQLPLVSGTALIRTGARLEATDKVGLGTMTTAVMRIGGTQQHPSQEINQLLEARAAVIESSIDTSSAAVSFRSLSEDLPSVFGLFAEIIQEPIFEPNQIDFIKTQIRGAISRRNDSPNEIANREFQKLIYGKKSPYARIVEYADINQITRNDLINFHQTYVRPDQIILGIVGDFDPIVMKQLIRDRFGSWNAPSEPEPWGIPQATQQQQGGVFVVDQPQLTQSTIALGHLGIQFDNPDYPAMSVLNGVLNGFGGRLFNQLRSRQGLAYSVYGLWQANYDYPGLFIAGGQTRSEATVTLIKALEKEIKQLTEVPISQDELAYAKDSILNAFVFNFENPSQTLSRLMRYEYFGYPEDFIFQYQQAVKDTTIEEVQRVAAKYLQPQKMVTLIVGNEKSIESSLSDLEQPVTELDITIPLP